MPRAFDLELERRWRERLRKFDRSGLAVREFCRSQAIQEYTFFWWRRELAKRDRLRGERRSVPRRPRRLRAKRAAKHRRLAVGESSSRLEQSRRTPRRDQSLRRSAFVPVQVIAEPLGTAGMEFWLGACLVRVPMTIDERALRQAIRVVREEVVGRALDEIVRRAVREEAAAC